MTISKLFGRKGERPIFPGNIVGDFAGGSLICVIGILLALIKRERDGIGQIIDASIVDGIVYLSTFVYKAIETPLWNQPRGENFLDSGAPYYDVYETKDKKYMAVGAIEENFYSNFLKGLSLDPSSLPSRSDRDNWNTLKEIFCSRFKEKTQSEWIKIFDELDACVTPVLSVTEFIEHSNTKSRKLWVVSDGSRFPSPSPRIKTSKTIANKCPKDGEHTIDILREIGYDDKQIVELSKKGMLKVLSSSKL